MATRPLPLLNAALFCDKVLQEQDGTVSLIRVVDRVQMVIPPQGLPSGFKPLIMIVVFIAVKSGPVIGERTVTIRIVRPSGNSDQVGDARLKLVGGDQGQNVVFNLQIGVDEEGLHWFPVIIDEVEITRIPLMILRQPPTPVPTL